jgi:hypothetical protein
MQKYFLYIRNSAMNSVDHTNVLLLTFACLFVCAWMASVPAVLGPSYKYSFSGRYATMQAV